MKKLAGAGTFLLLISLVLPSHAMAQQLSVPTEKDITAAEIPDTSSTIRYANDVSGRVLRSFRRSFGDKPGVTWSRTVENLFLASYKENNKTNCVYFSNNGAIDYTLSHYGEDQLSKEMRQLVKSNFYDYDIINVSEVHKNDSYWFFITVMNKASVKLIKVTEWDWEVIKELVRK